MSKLDSAAAKDGGTGPAELEQLYSRRFGRDADYRNPVWRTIIAAYFSRFIGPNQTVLDLGCGYGQFINNLRCGKKLAMDLNPQARQLLAPDVTFIEQDCTPSASMTRSSSFSRRSSVSWPPGTSASKSRSSRAGTWTWA